MRARGPAPAVQVTPRLFAEMVAALRTGQSQQQIARNVGLSFGTVNRWLAPVVGILREQGEPSRPMPRNITKPVRLTAEQVAEIGERAKTANSLRQIAEAMNLGKEAVRLNATPFIEAMRAAGTLGQCTCGRERFHPRFCSRTATNPAGRWDTPEQREKRAAIVAAIMAGDTFAAIGQRWDITSEGAKGYLRWLTPDQRAKRRQLQAERGQACTFRPHADQLYTRIAAAVPRWLSEATRDDAISDIYLAVLEGHLSANDVGKEASRYASRAVDQWESKFAPRSLNEPAYYGAKHMLGDRIADPASLVPLEHRLAM